MKYLNFFFQYTRTLFLIWELVGKTSYKYKSVALWIQIYPLFQVNIWCQMRPSIIWLDDLLEQATPWPKNKSISLNLINKNALCSSQPKNNSTLP